MRLLTALVFPLMLAAQREPLKFDIKWVSVRTNPPPGVQHHVLHSAAMNREVGFNVYLPPDYESLAGTRYPVIYWLHGSGGNESGGLPEAAKLHAAIVAGQIPPFDGGRDRLEQAAEFRLGIRLRVERIHVAHPAREKQVDDGDLVASFGPGLGTRLQDLAQRRPPKRRNRVDFQNERRSKHSTACSP